MNAVRDWAMSLCCAAVAGGIMSMLVPNTSMEKVFKMALSVFFLCAVLTPVAFEWNDISVDLNGGQQEVQEKVDALTKANEQQLYDDLEGRVRQIVQEVLEKNDIQAKQIEIIMTTGEDNRILINEIRITLDAGEQTGEQEIKRVIREKTGIEPTVRYPEDARDERK